MAFFYHHKCRKCELDPAHMLIVRKPRKRLRDVWNISAYIHMLKCIIRATNDGAKLNEADTRPYFLPCSLN